MKKALGVFILLIVGAMVIIPWIMINGLVPALVAIAICIILAGLAILGFKLLE
jgi:hypothetical protein